MESKTQCLHITNFVRPFTLSQAKALISETCTPVYFWMDVIKSQCYIETTTQDEADKTFEALNNRRWPEETGRQLKVSYVNKSSLPKQAENVKSSIGTLFKKTRAQPQIYYLPKFSSRESSRSRSRN